MTEHLSTFSESYSLPFDIDRHLFSAFFDSIIFTQWLLQNHKWQLHCIGSPGSGKTTFSALTMQRLRQDFRDRNDAVASIFLQSNPEPEAAFVQSVLESLFRQLSLRHTTADDVANYSYKEYQAACESAQGFSARIELLRKALDARLCSLNHAFLVLDDLDHCDDATSSVLGAELSRLQQHGLSIMVTSRVPSNVFGDDIYCDADTHDDESGSPLELYWICPDCVEEIYICSECREKEHLHIWKKCGHTSSLIEPYQNVTLSLRPCGGQLYNFLACALEREHGDLGLHSNPASSPLPPPSALGIALRRHPAAAIRAFVEDLASTADSNIAIARILLDLVHTADPPTLDGARAAVCRKSSEIPDRLPRPIVALFEASVTAIIAHQAGGLLALRALAAVAGRSDKSPTGTPFDEVVDEISDEADGEQGKCAVVSSVEQLLRATRGFLGVVPCPEMLLHVYHLWFAIYLRDRYDERVFWQVELEQQRRTKVRAFRFGMPQKVKTFAVVADQEVDAKNAAAPAPEPGLRKRSTGLTTLGRGNEAAVSTTSRREGNMKIARWDFLKRYTGNCEN